MQSCWPDIAGGGPRVCGPECVVRDLFQELLDHKGGSSLVYKFAFMQIRFCFFELIITFHGIH